MAPRARWGGKHRLAEGMVLTILGARSLSEYSKVLELGRRQGEAVFAFERIPLGGPGGR